MLFSGAYALGYFSANRAIEANKEAMVILKDSMKNVMKLSDFAKDATENVMKLSDSAINSKDSEISNLKDTLTKWEAEKLLVLSRAQAVVGNRVLLESGLASKYTGTKIHSMTARLCEFMTKDLFTSTSPIMTSPPSPGVTIPIYNLSTKSKQFLSELNAYGIHVTEIDLARGLHHNIIMNKYSQPHHYGGITPISNMGTGLFIGGDDLEAKQLAVMMLHLQSNGNLPFELELLCNGNRLCRLVNGNVVSI